MSLSDPGLLGPFPVLHVAQFKASLVVCES